ncbi:YfhO family protein [Companilactobacillus paralimentarius]|uniref:YfhO family protein n=1 Tax=Companilactobacillus paralimentarius TaxID=83526 RepID=UPI0028536C03|nr:YfhO family protein [Companilactobacillus paralimentarius]MDR4932282.1 YfhO family protein [Companilactobacillus paralimentarius]
MAKRYVRYYSGAFIINLIIISIIFACTGLVPFGSNNFLSSDLGTQYLTFLTELRRQIVSGNLHLYLFSQSLGDNFFPVMSYYLLSPFNLLLVFFSARNIPIAADILIMLKISTMGVTMAFFLKEYFQERSAANGIFTIAYSFCGFVASYFYDLMWLDALIMLPLVAVGVMRVIKHHQYVLYYFSILFSIIFNYYLGYMLCIFSVCFFIYIGLEDNLFHQQDKWLVIRRYLISSVLAGLSSAVVLLPTLIGMLKTAKTSFNILNYLPSARFGLEALTQLGIGGNSFDQRLEHGPSVFMTSTILILLLSYYLSSRVSNRDKQNSVFLLGILLISMFVTTFNTMWHMFQNPAGFPFRNSFIFSFACIFIARKAWQSGVVNELDVITKATCIAGILICLGYLTEWLLPKIIEKLGFDSISLNYSIDYFWLSLVCIILSGLTLLLLNRNKNFLLILFLMVGFEVIANFNSVMATADFGNQAIYQNEFDRENTILKEVKDRSNLGHRIIVSKSGLNKAFPEKYNNYNDPILFNINGLSLYSSTLNQNTLEMMKNLGYFSLNVRRISYYGGTKLTNALLGVYYRVRQWGSHYHVEENYKAPTLGFLADNNIYDFKMRSGQALSNQERLWQALNGNSTEYFKNSLLTSMQQSVIGNQKLYTYQLTTRTTGPLYFYVTPFNYDKSKIYVNGKRIKTSSINVYKAATLYLGNFKRNKQVEIRILTNKTLGLNPRYFQSLDQSKFDLSVDNFKRRSLNVKSDLNHDTVRGSINVDQDAPLLLSIPYDDGWSAYVDGKKVKINKVVSNLMAIDLKKGQHNVVLNYQVPGLKLGWLVSAVAVILFISFILIVRSKDKLRDI